MPLPHAFYAAMLAQFAKFFASDRSFAMRALPHVDRDAHCRTFKPSSHQIGFRRCWLQEHRSIASQPTNRRLTTPSFFALIAFMMVALTAGCNVFPDIKHKPQFHNPFPQLQRVAILPFNNQSKEPTLSGARVSLAYYNELQSIPGFEVLPLGVVERKMDEFIMQERARDPNFQFGTGEHFQRFAQSLGVDAVLAGAITDYDSYYPPRMTLKVNWYAANPGFHPIPAGYGLPWGTKAEKKIPEWIRLESERALATEQLKTQTPDLSDLNGAYSAERPQPSDRDSPLRSGKRTSPSEVTHAQSKSEKSNSDALEDNLSVFDDPRNSSPPSNDNRSSESALPKPNLLRTKEPIENSDSLHAQPARLNAVGTGVSSPNNPNSLPLDWPDPQGFIPAAPSASKLPLMAQSAPIISHIKAYNGSDEDFMEALSNYYYFRDDSRFGGHQAYLQRSEDFIRFCSHQHIIETLAARGGQRESRLILRWPFDRYAR